jgi:hypothetical protein
VTHDARVAQQPLDVARAHARHRLDLEAAEGAPEGLALAQDREPGEAGLEALEAELLEEPAVVGDGQAPLAVVIVAVERVRSAPGAARLAVVAAEHAGGESRCRGSRLLEAAVEGTSEVASAVFASVLTGMAVFFPIVFVEGIAGQIFKDLALTVVFSLLSSLAVALVFIPMLAAQRFTPGPRPARARDIPTSRFGDAVAQLREHIDAFIETYNQHAKPFVWTKARVHQKRIKVRFADQ